MTNLSKEKILKKLIASLFAIALMLGIVHATPAHAVTSIGDGVVDVYGAYTPAHCAQLNFPANCGSTGTGIVVPNQWSNNEVLTAYHILVGVSTVQIYEPFSGHHDFAYVQRVNVAKDEAVLWIYKSYSSSTGFKASDYNYDTSPLADARPGVGSEMQAAGDSNTNFLHPGMGFSVTVGSVLNKNTSVTCDGVVMSGLIQTTKMTYPGDSGGPLVDLNIASPNYGKVSGMNECSGTYSYAIYINTIFADMLGTRP